jgi:hypothetical protein
MFPTILLTWPFLWQNCIGVYNSQDKLPSCLQAISLSNTMANPNNHFSWYCSAPKDNHFSINIGNAKTKVKAYAYYSSCRVPCLTLCVLKVNYLSWGILLTYILLIRILKILKLFTARSILDNVTDLTRIIFLFKVTIFSFYKFRKSMVKYL